ncbi:hypothetical protein [Streptomyces sp. NPDC059262]|uniref:hypothetical protein n=1 Tax=Streptomyces sp. NPDC059262 TaxID=3346797 RepID=UPI0036791D17
MLLPEPCVHDPAVPRRPCAPHRPRRLGRLYDKGKVEPLVLVDVDTYAEAPGVEPPRHGQ